MIKDVKVYSPNIVCLSPSPISAEFENLARRLGGIKLFESLLYRAHKCDKSKYTLSAAFQRISGEA